jgi:hypothetical protein
MRTLFVFSLLCASAAAQPLSMAGVLVDHVSRTIRLVVAGEETASAGRPRVREFDAAWAAPDGRTALLSKSGTLYLVRRLDGSIPVWREFSEQGAAVGRAAWSEDASALALYLPGEEKLELWKKSAQGELRRAWSADLAAIRERIVSIAVAPDAAEAFLATQARDSGTLWILKQDQQPRMLLPLDRAGCIQLAGGALYVADRGRNEVLRYTGWDAMPKVDTLVTAGHGLADPVGFALLAEEKKLLVASAGTSQVLVLDLRSNQLREPVALDAPPAAFERLGAAPLFLLDAAPAAPARLFDASARRLLAMAPASGD